MKINFFSLLMLFATSIFSQDDFVKKIYLDSLGVETTPGKHVYYRIKRESDLNKKYYEETDYYLNDQIKQQGLFNAMVQRLPVGEHYGYYKSGKIKSYRRYSKGELDSDIYYTLYENGNKEIEGEYIKSFKEFEIESILKVESFWNQDNIQKVTKGNGIMVEQELFEITTGEIKEGFKEGIWEGVNSKYKIKFVDTFESGVLKTGIATDENDKKFNYTIIDKQPEFSGGTNGFTYYVQRNYKVPDIDINLKGKVILGFTVDVNGKISNIQIVQSLQKDCDQAGLKLLRSMGKLWMPGEYRGIKVNVKYKIPITLDIQVIEEYPGPSYSTFNNFRSFR